jgi:titin
VTSYSNTGLSCSTIYYYRVRAHRHTDGQFSAYSNVSNAATYPCTPSNLSALAISTTQVNLTWQDNSSDESEFHIERSPNGSTGWAEIATVGANVTSYSNTGLSCSTSYYYRVRAHRHSDGQFSPYSNVANKTTYPCTPANLTATAVSTSQINLAWQDKSSDESEFHLERSPNGTAGWTEIATVGANVIVYNNTGLSCGTIYFYRVRAHRHSDGQFSPYSNIANATTQTPCPYLLPPTNLNATAITHAQINLTWQDNSADESGFRIERSPNGSNNWMEIVTVGANMTSYNNIGLVSGTKYYYRIRAYRQSDNTYSLYSDISNATTPHAVFLPIVLKNA